MIRRLKDRFEHSIAAELFHRSYDHNVIQTGGQLAYFILLSVFPFLIYVNALIGVFQFTALEIREFLAPIFPENIVSMLTAYIENVSETGSVSLLSFGILVTLFSASRSVRALSNVMDTAYGVQKTRGFWWNLGFSILFIFCMGLVVVAIAIIIPISEHFFVSLTELFGLSDRVAMYLNTWRWAVTVVVLFFVLVLLYYVVPNRRMNLRYVCPGAVLGVVGFLFLTRGFSIYVTYFLKNSAIYGSINAVILLLLWLYCVGVILAVGAELNGIVEGRILKAGRESRSDDR